MYLRLFAVLCLACCPMAVHAWGELGHRAVAEAVQAELDEPTRDAIAKIVAPGQPLANGTLAELSVWPDRIRDLSTLPPDEQPTAQEFNRVHPFHRSWHFVNLPLKAPGYPDLSVVTTHDPLRTFIRTDPEMADIVQKTTDVIQILEYPGDTPGWTKTQALAWLLHLVQDLHQPLHVATGYYRLGKRNVPRVPMLVTPGAAAHKHVACDRGGNQLQFEDAPITLHSVWDHCLAQLEAGLPCAAPSGLSGVAALAGKITAWMQVPSSSIGVPTGNHHDWARRWATDSLHVADETELYHVTLAHPRTIGEPVPTQPGQPCHDQGPRILLSITAPTVLDEYVGQYQPVAALQLTKAAVRLSELLKRIEWK